MIQATKDTSLTTNRFRINLYDEMTSTNLLVTFTSQLTGNSKTFIPLATITTNKDRYLEGVYIVSDNDSLALGVLFLGNTDFPLGFYDVTIYENSSAVNLDPSGLSVVYTGLMNLSSTSNTRSVTYGEYTTNDSDTESVYITI